MVVYITSPLHTIGCYAFALLLSSLFYVSCMTLRIMNTMFHSYILSGFSKLLSARYLEISILHVKVFQVSSLVCTSPNILETDLYASIPSVLSVPTGCTTTLVQPTKPGPNVRRLMTVIYVDKRTLQVHTTSPHACHYY